VEFYEVYQEANKTDRHRFLKSKFSVILHNFTLLRLKGVRSTTFLHSYLKICPLMFTFFQLFNSGMDALLSQQGEWRVSSSLLREILGTKLLEEIYPYYEDFYNKYSKIQFSKKHMSEYLRFPPEDVERLLQNFFGKS
jgi:hypothetical protein